LQNIRPFGRLDTLLQTVIAAALPAVV
jgi:hypothetical protein